jgi:uncharacterized protein YkwD
MRRAALLPVLLLAAGLAGCGTTGSGSAPQPAPGVRVGPVSAGVTAGHLGGAVTDSSAARQRELARARRIDPRVLRPLPNVDEGVAGQEQCANADLAPEAGNLPAVTDATFCLLNAERVARGLRALTPDRRLQRAAALYGSDLVDHQYFAHEGRDGSRPAERIRAAGYLSSGGAWRIGENLAWGTGDLATPRAIVAAWMNSAGHRANILETHYREIGFGVVAGNPSAPDGAGATYVTEFGVVARPAGAATRRANGSTVAAHDRKSAKARRRAADRRRKARMRARRSSVRRARAALAPHSRRGRIVGRVTRTHAGLG